ncbi:MAG: NUDIX hydrolase [Syntrophobacteraceae bacterium]|nr:NUDIX hydrolase [Syntrophobacteraceae bacterium]
MNRRYPDRPMVGVGAIIFQGNRVLLVQRGREPSYGEWSIPGGLVELGENLRDAVQREVREESGLEVEVEDLAVALDRVILDETQRIEYHYVLLDFLCRWTGGEPRAASDALHCAFVPLEDLARYRLTRGTEEAIHRVYRLSRGMPGRIYDPEL